jgi:serine/threonine protein kinase
VHKDIKPAHIAVNTASGQFRLIGFGIADALAQSQAALQPPATIEGNLAYIAPEQTGRMNRRVDYRSEPKKSRFICYNFKWFQMAQIGDNFSLL